MKDQIWRHSLPQRIVLSVALAFVLLGVSGLSCCVVHAGERLPNNLELLMELRESEKRCPQVSGSRAVKRLRTKIALQNLGTDEGERLRSEHRELMGTCRLVGGFEEYLELCPMTARGVLAHRARSLLGVATYGDTEWSRTLHDVEIVFSRCTTEIKDSMLVIELRHR